VLFKKNGALQRRFFCFKFGNTSTKSENAMTPAIALLEKLKIKFEILSYEHDANNSHYGLEAVEKLNLNSEQVFKTLVLETHEGELIVAITPVPQKVNLK